MQQDQAATAHAGVAPPARRPRVVIVGGRLCRPQRGQGPRAPARRRHRRRPPQPPHLSAAALPGGAGRAFAGRHRPAHPLHPAPPAQYRSADGRSRRHRRRRAASRSRQRRAASPTTTSSWPPAPLTPTSATTSGSRSRRASRPLKTPSRFAAACCWPSSWPSARCSSTAGTLRSISSSSAAGPPASNWPAPSATSPSSTCATTSATSTPPRAACCCSTAAPRVLAAYPAGSLRQSRGRRSSIWASKSTPNRRSPASARAGSRPTASASTPPSPCGPRACRPRRWARCWASPNVTLDRRGCVIVDDHLNPPGLPDVFVLGDLAHFEQDGHQVPGVAQPAMQMGDHVAKMIAADLAGKPPPAFRYFDKGDMATIGRMAAVAKVEVALQGAHERLSRLVHMGHRPHLLSHRLPQPALRAGQLGLDLLHLHARRAPHHRRPDPSRLAEQTEAGPTSGGAKAAD